MMQFSKKQKSLIYMTIVISFLTHFLQNSKIQCYGFILLLYTKSNYQLVNSTNRLKFNVLNNDQRDRLIFQLEDILSPYQIKTTDSKIQY